MGVEKKVSRKKTEILHVRLTPTDMAIIRERCTLSGYKSLTKFVTRSLVDVKKPYHRLNSAHVNSDASELLNSHLNVLTQQIRGIAANYNQSVAIMNSLCKSIDERKVKYMIVKQAANLESLTKEMIDRLREVRDSIKDFSDKTILDTIPSDD